MWKPGGSWVETWISLFRYCSNVAARCPRPSFISLLSSLKSESIPGWGKEVGGNKRWAIEWEEINISSTYTVGLKMWKQNKSLVLPMPHRHKIFHITQVFENNLPVIRVFRNKTDVKTDVKCQMTKGFYNTYFSSKMSTLWNLLIVSVIHASLFSSLILLKLPVLPWIQPDIKADYIILV